MITKYRFVCPICLKYQLHNYQFFLQLNRFFLLLSLQNFVMASASNELLEGMINAQIQCEIREKFEVPDIGK